MPWSSEFEDAIDLPDGRKLATLRDAATYITKLPKAEQDLEIWQVEVAHLIRAAETGGGWTWLASIGLLRALHRDRKRSERRPEIGDECEGRTVERTPDLHAIDM
jgi:hypothetical protein